ncbi:MAG TPA: hypothetical protein VMS86_07540 [Thermoanaerobaculia bacterium]|nr:hypothetical protein [Thermoanaerobaculia bacterium]
MAYVGTYTALTAGLFVLLYLTGHAASRRFLASPRSFEEGLGLRVVTGVAVWVALLFSLAAVQLLRPSAIYAAIALAAAAGVWSVLRRNGALLSDGAGARAPVADALPGPRLRQDPAAILLAVVVAAVLVALWAQALRPIVAWDADVYHLTVPRLYLEHGGFRRIAFNVYSNWPLAVQLLYALAMAVKDYILATALHFGFGVLLATLAGALVARAATPLWGVIAAGLLLLHPVLLFEIRIAYVDVACAFFLFAGFLALLRALDDPENELRFLLAAGIACGVLAAAKLNGVFGAVAIAAVYAGSRLSGGAPAAALARPLLAFAAPVVVLGLPWLAKSLWLTGNPVYPLLHDVFGGPEWSEPLARAHRAWQRSIGMGRSPLDYLLLPFRALFSGGEGYARFDGRLHPLAGILLPCALLAARREPLVRRALGVAGLYFALWAATSQQMRLLIPVLPLLAVATAVAGHSLTSRWLPRPALAARGLAALLAVLLLQASAVYVGQAPRLYAALWTRGDELRAHATDEVAVGPDGVEVQPGVFGVIDELLPADAKLLFVNLNRGFFSRREYVADSFFEASQVAAMLQELGDREGIRRGLAERGITHVLVERQEGGPRYPQGFVELLEDPATRVVYRSRDGRFTLFALAPQGIGAS